MQLKYFINSAFAEVLNTPATSITEPSQSRHIDLPLIHSTSLPQEYHKDVHQIQFYTGK